MAEMHVKNKYAQRLEAFLASQEISFYRLSLVMQTQQNRIMRALDKKHGLDSDILNQISQHFPNLNIDWIVTGRGDMLHTPQPETGMVMESRTEYHAHQPVKLVSRHSYAAYMQFSEDNAFLRKLPDASEMRIPGSFRDFEVVGKQLQTPDQDGIEDGDIIRTQFIAADLYQKVLRPGDVAVIVTRKDIFISQIHNLTPKDITLHPWNPQYQPVTVPISTIKELWTYHSLHTHRDFKHFLYR